VDWKNPDLGGKNSIGEELCLGGNVPETNIVYNALFREFYLTLNCLKLVFGPVKKKKCNAQKFTISACLRLLVFFLTYQNT